MTSFSFSKGQKLEVTIESMASTGNGIARHEGMVIFVADSAPGDRVRIRLTRCKKNFCEAETLEVLEASPHRTAPSCKVFGQCGGCSWQHIDYSEQVRQKHQIVKSALERVAKQEAPDFECVPSPKPYRYRNRIQLHYIEDKVGFHGRKSNRIVPIEDCPIAREELIPLFAELRQRNAGQPERAELRIHHGKASVFSSEHEAGFIQANDEQNKQMKSYVFDLIRGSKPGQIADLYCGSGNFTFELEMNFPNAKVIGVDSNQNSIRAAQQRSQNPHVQFECADAEQFLSQFSESLDLVVVDPPRSGCDENLIEALKNSNCNEFVYISCDPATWARDLARLDWSLEELRTFDMFPQTPHVEVVSLLKRKNAAQ